jgi:hypothetical protein
MMVKKGKQRNLESFPIATLFIKKHTWSYLGFEESSFLGHNAM